MKIHIYCSEDGEKDAIWLNGLFYSGIIPPVPHSHQIIIFDGVKYIVDNVEFEYDKDGKMFQINIYTNREKEN